MPATAVSSRAAGFDRLLLLVAVAVASVRSVIAPGLGDYPRDAGPALSAIAHGSLSGFFAHQPAMGALSLYLRAPFVLLAAALHDSPMGLYRWGDLPCMLSVAVIAVWLARIAGRRGMTPLGQVLIVAICLFNPLVNDALYWGHPEELLTSSLTVGALLAAIERKGIAAAVLCGLAIASKQWALLAVCPVLLVLERERIRCAVAMICTWAAITLPMVVGNFAAFRHALAYISNSGAVVTSFNWVYPVSPAGTAHQADPFGGFRVFHSQVVPAFVQATAHPMIILLGFVVPLLLFVTGGRRLGERELLTGTALVLLFRCVLDPETMPYYHVPLLLVLVALDVVAGRRFPVAGMLGFAFTFTVLDRFAFYVGTGLGNAIYVIATIAIAAILVRELRSGVQYSLNRRLSGGDRLGELPRIAAAGPG